MTTLMEMEHRSPAEVANYDRRWWILAVLGIAQLMVILDGTIVNIALPTAQHDLHFSNADRQWVVTAYSLAFGSLLLLGGRIGLFLVVNICAGVAYACTLSSFMPQCNWLELIELHPHPQDTPTTFRVFAHKGDEI